MHIEEPAFVYDVPEWQAGNAEGLEQALQDSVKEGLKRTPAERNVQWILCLIPGSKGDNSLRPVVTFRPPRWLSMSLTKFALASSPWSFSGRSVRIM